MGEMFQFRKSEPRCVSAGSRRSPRPRGTLHAAASPSKWRHATQHGAMWHVGGEPPGSHKNRNNKSHQPTGREQIIIHNSKRSRANRYKSLFNSDGSAGTEVRSLLLSLAPSVGLFIAVEAVVVVKATENLQPGHLRLWNRTQASQAPPADSRYTPSNPGMYLGSHVKHLPPTQHTHTHTPCPGPGFLFARSLEGALCLPHATHSFPRSGLVSDTRSNRHEVLRGRNVRRIPVRAY